MDEDVERIAGLGYEEKFFVAKESQAGFKVLKNSRAGMCVFHDGTKCTIYENRPRGCKLYPIIFDEDLRLAVRDKLCPFRDEFLLTTQTKHELEQVYLKLIEESQDHRRENSKNIRKQ